MVKTGPKTWKTESDVYSEPCRTSNMEQDSSIVDVWQDSEYVSVKRLKIRKNKP